MKNQYKNDVFRMLVIVGVLVAPLGVSAPVALAQGHHEITDAQARRIAVRAVPGSVVEIEREDDELEVLVRARDGRLMEVELDTHTGRVLEVEPEEDEGEEDEG